MSIEEIIDGLVFYRLKLQNGIFGDRIAVFDEAIAKLRTHQDAQPNEPLTLEELRKMDGYPVWCQPDEGVGCWVLVTVSASKVVVRDQYGMTGDVEVWMKRGERYYRRPPKEGEL